MLEGSRTIFSAGTFQFQTRHLLVIAILALAFTSALIMRFYPIKYGYVLNEFDPYFDYRATQFILDNGLDAYWTWHDDMSWYPEGRDVAATSQSVLHITAAYLYQAFGGGMSLMDFTIAFPAVMGSLTVVAVFALVRVLGGTTAGLFSAILFAFSPSIIQRGNLGWFKSEPLGLFFGLVAFYLFISAIKQKELKYALAKAVVGAVILGLANGSWGGVQYFAIPLSIFFIALPFFRRDLTIPMYVVIAFTVVSLLSSAAFPRPGLSYILGLPGIAMIGGTVFLVIANFLRRIGGPRQQQRNTIYLLIGFIAAAAGIIAAGAFIAPSYRYFNAVNPFISTQNFLVESVAEHFTPTVADYFTDFSILLMFAGLGIWLAFRRRDDTAIFALIIGFTGVYVSATFARLLVFASIGIIVLAGLGLYEVTRSILAYREANASSGQASAAARATALTREERRKAEFGSFRTRSGQITRMAYVVVIIMMLSIPLFFPSNANWLSSADVPAAISNGGTGFRTSTDDWTDALNWIATNTPEDAVVASWWDYGYWITTLGERPTLADNATINQTRIETIAKMLISDEQAGLRIAQDLRADYIVVYVVAQIRLFGSPAELDPSTNATTTGEQVPLYSLGQGGDESKKQWFMRIGGFNEMNYIHGDGFTPTPAFWNNTLLGKMMPFSPASYVMFGGDGSIQNIRNATQGWQQGFVGLYTKNIKYPADGGADQPLRLVYSSPSFNEGENIAFGVFVYEINKSYVPQPVEAPVIPPEPVTPAPVDTEEPVVSSEIAVIETTQGTIKIEFFPEEAPGHVENFINLANDGFYDGVVFHRLVPGFVIQAGDPNTVTGTDRTIWGTGDPGYNIDAEFNDIEHQRGIVSMARSFDPDSAGSQFFIVLERNAQTTNLDGQYTVFGRVIEGMDVVDKIAALEKMAGADSSLPANPDDARILSVTIEER
ncbi:MAG TPA: peptidylprolyl isomerase [Nitrososphaera sp.]|nr:peptidylprolyl isomerase [Nitrososphaera sp.]